MSRLSDAIKAYGSVEVTFTDEKTNERITEVIRVTDDPNPAPRKRAPKAGE